MSDDIRDGVLQWLRQTGYPFQLFAGRALQSAGWHVNYSRWYKDLELKKDRELDLQAITAAFPRHSEGSVFVSLCIECKVLSKPWVGLSSREITTDTTRTVFDRAPGIMTPRVARAARVLGIEHPRLFPSSILHAESIVAAHTKAEDQPGAERKSRPGTELTHPASPHSALLQAVAAARAIDIASMQAAIAKQHKEATAGLVIPAVLVRGRLFSYSVAADLSAELVEVGELLTAVPVGDEGNSTLVAVLTEDAAAENWKPMLDEARRFCMQSLPQSTRLAEAIAMSDQDIEDKLRQ